VNCHPPVALWLAKHSRRRSLAGFQTHEAWGKSSDIRISPWIEGSAPRFVAVNVFVSENNRAEPKSKTWTFEQAAQALLDRVSKDQQSVRIAGPSGFGKSRFVYEVFNRHTTLADQVDNAIVIYADFSIVGDEAAKLALEIAENGSSSILVVDECPDQVHHKLAGIAQRADSCLRIVTIDVETKILHAENTLTIRLEPAPDDMISAIAKGVDPKINESGIPLIQELSQGFPQMAVLAAQQKASGKQTIQSAQQYIDRVLWGHRSPNTDEQKALSILSLFDWVGLGGRVSEQAEYIAAQLAHMPLEVFVEHIKSFKARGVVIQRGDFVQVQPIPLAARLAVDRLSLLPDRKLFLFFKEAPVELKASLLKRMRWLDTAPEAKAFARLLLADNAIGNLETLNTKSGSEALDRLVHVEPDLVISTIDRVFGKLTIHQLAQVTHGRRHLVWALEKLAFRKNSFERVARLLRRLGAAENEGHMDNNATGQFKGFFRLYLSGTEADPAARLRILDEGLHSDHAKERELCVDALDEMLETRHFGRSGGAELIGSGDPSKDWQPKTHGDIRNFFRAGISRLTEIALSDDPFAAKAKTILGRRIRALLNQMEPKEIKSFVDAVMQRDGFWPEAVQEINEWLFFDSNKAPAEIRKEIRPYFDELMPSDPVELAALYCHGWQADFHDPDSTYDKEERSGNDFDYAARKSVELATIIAADPPTVERAVQVFATSDAKSVFSFARRLAELVPDAVALFNASLENAEATSYGANLQFFGGIIAGADARDPKMARECVRAALRSAKLKPNAISMIGAGKLQAEDLKLVASLLQSGDVDPSQCAPLSFGRGLDHLTSEEIMPLLDELTQHGATGLWTALDMIIMYLYPGRTPDSPLERKLKEILLSVQLSDSVNRRTMDGHHLEQAIALLVRHNMLDPRYVRALVKRLLTLTKKQSDVYFELDDPVRDVLSTLIPLFPNEVWSEVAPMLLAKKPFERHRIQQLLDSGMTTSQPECSMGCLQRSTSIGLAKTPQSEHTLSRTGFRSRPRMKTVLYHGIQPLNHSSLNSLHSLLLLVKLQCECTRPHGLVRSFLT
ncbi:MAG: hypothetical protein ACRD8U_22520, partial [Pyrinomonadaceae bacterium]